MVPVIKPQRLPSQQESLKPKGQLNSTLKAGIDLLAQVQHETSDALSIARQFNREQ